MCSTHAHTAWALAARVQGKNTPTWRTPSAQQVPTQTQPAAPTACTNLLRPQLGPKHHGLVWLGPGEGRRATYPVTRACTVLAAKKRGGGGASKQAR